MASIDELRGMARQMHAVAPDMAEKLDRALDEVDAGKRDLASINVDIAYRLEKFDGEYRPGLVPVETIEGKG